MLQSADYHCTCSSAHMFGSCADLLLMNVKWGCCSHASSCWNETRPEACYCLICRQKISHDTEVEPSSSSRSGQLRATQAPQTATQQQPEEQARQHAVVFQELLKQAIDTCVQRGELPSQGGSQVHFPVLVSSPSVHQMRTLHAWSCSMLTGCKSKGIT